MNPKFKNLSKISSEFSSASSLGYAFVRHQVSDAGTAAFKAGKSVKQTVSNAINQVDTGKATAMAKELAQSAAAGTQNVTSHFVDMTRKADANHKELAYGIETVSMGLGITAGVTAAGAALAAPTGLGAAAVALGFTSAPLIVVAAPVVAAAATAAGVVSGGAYFYSKWRTKSIDANVKRETEQTAGE